MCSSDKSITWYLSRVTIQLRSCNHVGRRFTITTINERMEDEHSVILCLQWIRLSPNRFCISIVTLTIDFHDQYQRYCTDTKKYIQWCRAFKLRRDSSSCVFIKKQQKFYLPIHVIKSYKISKKKKKSIYDKHNDISVKSIFCLCIMELSLII